MRREPALTRKNPVLGPRRRAFTHALVKPSRSEWLEAIRVAAGRADHFALCWREGLPGANGWRSDFGLDRMAPFALDHGATDFPHGAYQMVGRLTPAALAALCAEPPHGLVDLEPEDEARYGGLKERFVPISGHNRR